MELAAAGGVCGGGEGGFAFFVVESGEAALLPQYENSCTGGGNFPRSQGGEPWRKSKQVYK